MIDFQLIFSVLAGIGILLFLILHFKIQAFLALLISSIAVGLMAGMEPLALMDSIKTGMGNTLGFVATVVGLGAIFGAILEQSGAAGALANYFLKKMGEEKAPWAMTITGFLVAIPVFFDVAFIILVPLIYSLQRRSGKSLYLFAIPLLAGLAATHSFIPPTPGPVAVADILGADLGLVILFGFVVGIPAVIISGPILAKRLAAQTFIAAPPLDQDKEVEKSDLKLAPVLAIIAVPIVLIVLNTISKTWLETGILKNWLEFFGHPFSALIIANLLAWYFMGIRNGFSKEALADISTKSLAPAGIIILLTGAGGVFKQILMDTGTGQMLADAFAHNLSSPFIFAFVMAALMRIVQGSATVSMITSAGMTAALISSSDLSSSQLALLVIAIASGATVLSHVNDSGFWLINRYLGLSVKQTFRSWTVMTTLLGISSFILTLVLAYFV
ncbi:Gnt-I system low-affinity gluconate transporter [Reichenbachiella faecimaris]|uniref:Gnt-I system low-affinity gluconate transporter n=1 Tax=Reichenbachiella faecimaris TaxID=692418 RepID=A0A1W2GP09_REIFA|nr:gluconate:H+ symporter [Reichenbachiella faecimaris]SMD38385.1 Gnt-I system low-affinity gluconate transporter [Reichenbachiella faecimaris]